MKWNSVFKNRLQHELRTFSVYFIVWWISKYWWLISAKIFNSALYSTLARLKPWILVKIFLDVPLSGVQLNWPQSLKQFSTMCHIKYLKLVILWLHCCKDWFNWHYNIRGGASLHPSISDLIDISSLQCYSVLSTIAQVLRKMSLKILASWFLMPYLSQTFESYQRVSMYVYITGSEWMLEYTFCHIDENCLKDWSQSGVQSTYSFSWTIEPQHEVSNNVVCATSRTSDLPAHMRSLIRAFACRLNILWVLCYLRNIIWRF